MDAQFALKKNQVILWSRDILGQVENCVIMAGDTDERGQSKDSGCVAVASVDGKTLRTLTTEVLLDSPETLQKLIAGKQVIVAGLPEKLVRQTTTCSAASVVQVLDKYGDFLGTEVKLANNCSAANLNTWVQNVIKTMASTSMLLDQADTGAAKWTASHFKVKPGMLEKLRSLINN